MKPAAIIIASLAALSILRADEPSKLRPWNDYRVIMWVGESGKPEKFPLLLQRFREMGVNTGMVTGDEDPTPWVKNNFQFYVENCVNKGLCLKWNSKLQKPQGGDRWDDFITDWSKTGRKKDALVREYCLDDPKWLDWAKERMRIIARKQKDFHPLAYNIRDELSTTISANPFDYDFSPITLAKFREWLKTQYKDLDALNAEWETKFAAWDNVMPFTTDEIKNRMASGDAIPRGNPDWQALAALTFDPVEARKNPTRWNFSPWCDFRTYMDISLAHALDEIRKAAHEIDPETPVGIEGTQMPHAFGGYDLWRLSQVLDWVEPYDIGCSREILGSFMPGKPFVTTVFESDTNHAKRRLWHLLLEGDKGCIIWWSNECIDWKSDDYALTPKAKALAPALKEMTSPLAQLFLRAQRQYDPIAIHYSQPSIQVDWLLESTVDGSTWIRRFSSYEAEHNMQARVRNYEFQRWRDIGYTPRFQKKYEMEDGTPDSHLPLSKRWSIAFTELTFDQHGKWLGKPRSFLPEKEFKSEPEVVLSANKPGESHTAVNRYKLGNAKLIAVERNINYQMSEELKQASGNEALEKSIDLEAKLAKPAHVYDLRAQKYLGQTDHVSFTLDPWQPTLFALLPEKIPAENVIEWLSKQK